VRRRARHRRARSAGHGHATDAMVRDWEHLYKTRGPLALIDATSGYTNNIYVSDLWSGAMHEHFGPTGLHKSRTNADGTPDAEARMLPSVQRSIENGREKVQRTFALLRTRGLR
jgi:hypothetical protein